jgi:hypothetical protein
VWGEDSHGARGYSSFKLKPVSKLLVEVKNNAVNVIPYGYSRDYDLGITQGGMNRRSKLIVTLVA